MTWKLEPHDGYMSDETPPIQIVDDTGKVVACNTTFYPTAIKAEHAATIVAAVNGRAELVADGEWLAHFIQVYSNHIPKVGDAHRIKEIAARLSGVAP